MIVFLHVGPYIKVLYFIYNLFNTESYSEMQYLSNFEIIQMKCFKKTYTREITSLRLSLRECLYSF